MWKRLSQDPIVRLAGVVFALFAAPYLLPTVAAEQRHWFGENVPSLAFILLSLTAIHVGLKKTRPSAERRFWYLWGAVFGIWWVAELWNLLLSSESDVVLNASQDFLYFAFYALMAWSIESRPHIPRVGHQADRLGSLEPAGGSVFVLGLLVYLVAVPAAFDPRSYLSTIPVHYFFILLDAYLSVRVIGLLRSCRSRRWRAVYGFLLATFVLWILTDGANLLMHGGMVPEVDYGTWLDVLWWLPFASFILAARAREAFTSEPDEPAPPESDDGEGWAGQAVLGLDPSLLLAVVFLVFHFALSLLVTQPPVVRSARALCALTVLLSLAGLSLVRIRRLRALSRRAEAERRQAEEARARLEDNLHQAQRLEAIGVLTGGIAHDFNNLMTAVKGHAELALSPSLSPEAVRDDLAIIAQTADRATELTRQLLAFGRQQVLRPRVTDLNDVVRGLEKLLRSSIGEDLKLVLRLDERLGRVEVDPGQIERALLNLAVNARDAMLAGGCLTIETANRDLPHGLDETVEPVEPGPYVTITVADNGVGMDEEVRLRAFEPFFSTKERDRGTGLGLAAVHGIVRQSGGHIQLASERGVGSRFTIYLPRVGEHQAGEETGHPQSADATGTETLLLVEDDAHVRFLLQRTLELQGYRVLAAEDAERALMLAAENPGVDLLVTDVVLPGLSGPDLAKLRPWPQVLFISGYADEKLRAKGLSDPEVPFLEKPFAPRDLVRRVREMLDGTAESPPAAARDADSLVVH